MARVSNPSRPAARHIAYHVLREQLARPGCAVCMLAAAAVRQAVESLCHEGVTDPGVRERLRGSHGCCAEHTRLLNEQAGRLAVAILYDDLLSCLERELEPLADTRWRPPRRPPRELPCPLCEVHRDQQQRCVRVLAVSIEDAELAAALRGSDGLCRAHLLSLCRQVPPGARRRLVEEELARLAQLRAQLAAVRRKYDHRFAGEAWGEELTAPERAIARLCGEAQVPDEAPVPASEGSAGRVPPAGSTLPPGSPRRAEG